MYHVSTSPDVLHLPITSIISGGETRRQSEVIKDQENEKDGEQEEKPRVTTYRDLGGQ